jgi:hypothetical protein
MRGLINITYYIERYRAAIKESLPQRTQRTRKGRKINNFAYQYFANLAKILASFAVRELRFFRSAPSYSVIQLLNYSIINH